MTICPAAFSKITFSCENLKKENTKSKNYMYVATPQTLNSVTKMDNLLIIKILQRNTEIRPYRSIL